MSYHLEFDKKAIKQLKRLDKPISEFIVRWLYKHIDGTDNPRGHGKALTGNKKGLWRYRIGSYRVICEIVDNELVILAVEVGHRKEIYIK